MSFRGNRGGGERGGFSSRGGRGFSGGEGSFRGGRGGRGFGDRDEFRGRGGSGERGSFRGGIPRGFGRGGSGGRGFAGGNNFQDSFSSRHNNNNNNHHNTVGNNNKAPQDICIFLVNAGLYLGQDGLVDAYDRGLSTEVNNESVVAARPDIIHQCLLSIFDSELGAAGRVRVFIYTTRGKTVEVSPHLRPPRTYDRFKGLMATLLTDGKVLPNMEAEGGGGATTTTTNGAPLLQILQGSIAPMIPEGADVIGITNAKHANIATPLAVAQYCTKNPISQQLRAGRKGVMAFFCIDCRDEADPSEEPSVTKLVSLSPYPQAPHTQAIRLCEGFQFLNPAKNVTPKGASGVRRQRDE